MNFGGYMNRFFYTCLICALVLTLSCSKSGTASAHDVVANLIISPPGGLYDETISVLIYCSTYEATIYYTTDGSDPTLDSEVYTGLLQINTDTTLKARAFRTGYISSSLVTTVYEFSASGVEPVVINPDGGSIFGPQEVNMSCITPNAQIYYTLDGSDPQLDSHHYTQPIIISGSLTLKARAFVDGQIPSIISTAVFTSQTPLPVFSPAGGIYTTPQTITISHPYPNASIRYTLDGSEPNENSSLYMNPIIVSSNAIIKAIVFVEDWLPSSVVTEYYFINLSSPMKLVEGGSFHNGTAIVQLSDFYIGRREVTELEWVNIMLDMDQIVPDRPKNNLNWVSAIEYCNYRSMAEGLEPCYRWGDWGTIPALWPTNWQTDHTQVKCNWDANGYRLPTEMEWMYAARGGQLTADYLYSGSNDIEAIAWYSGNAQEPQVVGMKQPNELGLFDLSGNVWEFCWDIYHDEYPNTETLDPVGPVNGFYRAMRGGSFSNGANSCTVNGRFYTAPNLRADSHGFRVVRRP